MQPDLVLSLCRRAFVVVGEGEENLDYFYLFLIFTPSQPGRLYQGERVGQRERQTDRQTETWGEREADRQRDTERGSTKAEKIIIISTQYRSVWSNIRHAAQMKASPTAYL